MPLPAAEDEQHDPGRDLDLRDLLLTARARARVRVEVRVGVRVRVRVRVCVRVRFSVIASSGRR